MKKTSFLGLRTTIYKVPDLSAAIRWYSAVFNTEPYFSEPFYAGFNIAGYELGLQPEETPAPKTGNVVTFWGVSDAQQEYDRLVEQGAIPLEPPMNVGGEIIVATVKDPWDSVIGIIYNPEFSLV
jgi:predicted enzyme related to lactoylglutathione lyase